MVFQTSATCVYYNMLDIYYLNFNLFRKINQTSSPSLSLSLSRTKLLYSN